MIIHPSDLLYKILEKPEAYPLMLTNPNMTAGRFQNLRQKYHIIQLDLQNKTRYGIVPNYSRVKTEVDEDMKFSLGFGNSKIFEDNVSITILGPAILFLSECPKDLIDTVAYTFDVQAIPNTKRYATMVAYMRSLPKDIHLEENKIMIIGKIE